MSEKVTIIPCGSVNGSIRPPGSKSLTNRALICAALAEGESELSGVLDSEDTQVMIQAWRQIGLQVEHDKQTNRVRISGGQFEPTKDLVEIYVANSGTTIRFLTAALSALHGKFRLHGVERMHARPIGDLLRALNQLGAEIVSENPSNVECPPIQIHADGLQGGRVEIAGDISSQFLSGLMMAAPLARQPVEISVQGELVSVPYVTMTAKVMEAFGATVAGSWSEGFRFQAGEGYRGTRYPIEPDASAASYFWAAAAITGGRGRVVGLNANSLQGDVAFCSVLEQMGCKVIYEDDAIEVIGGGELRGVDVNMADISDTVQTLAAVALHAHGPTSVTGVAHNRVKETDRIGDLATELRKLGAEVQERQDGLVIVPPEKIQPAVIETYHDHRMAMSLSLAGLRNAGISILDPACTGKTYPKFWDDLQAFTGCGVSRSD